MADNFDIVEEALRLLSPKRYQGGGEVKHFDWGGGVDGTTSGSLNNFVSNSFGMNSGLGGFNNNTNNVFSNASSFNAVSDDGDTQSDVDYTYETPAYWASVGIGALDSRLWDMFVPESGSMSSEFSAHIMGLIIQRALAGPMGGGEWTPAKIAALQQRVDAEVTQYIKDTSIYDLIADDPFNAEFVEYVVEKKAGSMGVNPAALASMVTRANAAAATQAAGQKKGVLATAQEKADAAIEIVNEAIGGIEAFIDDKLSGVHDVIDKIHGKGQEFIDAIWDEVPEAIKVLWPNAGIVYNTSTGTVTGTWEFGTGTPPILPGGSPGIVIGNINPAGGWITPQKSSAIILTTGSAIKDKIINTVLGKGKMDIPSIKEIVLGKLSEITGIPVGILKGNVGWEELIQIILAKATTVTANMVATAENNGSTPTLTVTQGCHPGDKENCWTDLDGDCNCPPDPNTQAGCTGVWCTADDERNEGCYGTDTNCNPQAFIDKCADKQTECEADGQVASNNCEFCVDAPVDPALQACLDGGCEGIDDAGNCTGCPLTPLQECENQNCTGIDDAGNCTGCECPKPCADPDNQTQASFADGCGCVDNDPCADTTCSTGYKPEANDSGGCDCVAIDPCADTTCPTGYKPEANDSGGCDCVAIDPCADTTCSTGYQPEANDSGGCDCVEIITLDPCADTTCSTGYQPEANDSGGCDCVEIITLDPCADTTCSTGYQPEANDSGGCDCVEIITLDPCADTTCSTGYQPEANDSGGCDCVEIITLDPCADTTCSTGYQPEANDSGGCDCVEIITLDPCADTTCSTGYQPEANDSGGCDCVEIITLDPCADTTCPTGYKPEANDSGGCDCVEIITLDPCADTTCSTGYQPEANDSGGCDCVEIITLDPCADTTCSTGYQPEANDSGGCDCVEIITLDPCADTTCSTGYQPEANDSGGCDCVEIITLDPCADTTCSTGYQPEANDSGGCDCVEIITLDPCADTTCSTGYQPEANDSGGCDCVEIITLDPCADTTCSTGYQPEANDSGGCDCVEIITLDPCADTTCSTGYQPEPDGEGGCDCVEIITPDPCADTTCDVGYQPEPDGEGGCDCVEIITPDPCADTTCDVGYQPEPDGEGGCDCVEIITPDPCADTTCSTGYKPEPDGEGGCDCVEIITPDPCADTTCSTGYKPEANDSGGCDCVEIITLDPCADTTCSTGYQPEANDSGGCDCVPIVTGCDDPVHAAMNPCDCQDGYAENNAAECGVLTGCDDPVHATLNPCDCQDGYAAANPDECTVLTPCQELEAECAKIGECADCDNNQCIACSGGGCDDPVHAALNPCDCQDGYAENNPVECNVLTPCQELEGECDKIGECADCETMQCIPCSGSGCTAAQQALCPEATLDTNCNCPTVIGPVTTPGTLPAYVRPPAIAGSRRTITSEPPELVDIDYLYDVGGTSIFPTNMNEFLNPDTDDTVMTAAKGGIVQDDVVEVLINMLRGR